MANEEDTVVVGQDLVRIELGGEAPPPKADSEAASSKDAAPSKPEPTKTEESKPSEQSSTAPPPQQKKAEPKKETTPKQTEAGKNAPKSSTDAAFGNREERRVCEFTSMISLEQ